MSLTLILTRHAKSDWAGPHLADRDRPLNARGRRDAPRIGAWLAREGFAPASVSVSAAARTRETWSLIRDGLGAAAPAETHVALSADLYHAEPARILAHVRNAATTCHMVIGHNPGIGALASDLVRAPPRHGRFVDYPTGATLVLRFETRDWREVGRGAGAVLAFVTPHDLPETD